MRAALALNLELLQDDPLEGRQDLRLLAVPRLPDELPVVAASPAAERFHAPGHDQFPVPGQGLLEKICQDLRQQRTERGKKHRRPAIRKKNPELTVEFHRDICSLWGHSHIALSFV
ncbi:MAG: hypothetical protein ACYCYP_13875 [Leptospirales bacterium]